MMSDRYTRGLTIDQLRRLETFVEGIAGFSPEGRDEAEAFASWVAAWIVKRAPFVRQGSCPEEPANTP